MSKRKSVRFVEDQVPTDNTLLRMSKRRRNAYDDGGGGQDESAYSDIGKTLEPRPGQQNDNGNASKHTLDSDEEEEEKYDRLNVADVEGQEDATLEFDADTKITPFNMNEEMDEGHFDTDGTFIFNKKQEDIRDAWLDNIDWAKIKKDAGDLWKGEEEGVPGGDDDSTRSSAPMDRTVIYESILQFLKPQETITKALKRLGGSRSMSDLRKARWREKKKGSSETGGSDTAQQDEPVAEPTEMTASTATMTGLDENAIAVVKLTELVDSLVSEGEFEVYGFTYEKIRHELERAQKAKAMQETKKEKSTSNTGGGKGDDDDELDMFAEEIDEKNLQTGQPPKETQSVEKNEGNDTSSSDVSWEFKWKNEEEAAVYGPCSSEKMLQWTNEGYFKGGVWVRRVGQQNAPFYSSKRIDFELYT